MSHRFSRNRSRAQPTPKACKSKHLTPTSPPPWNNLAMQIAISLNWMSNGGPVTFSETLTLPLYTDPELYYAQLDTSGPNWRDYLAVGNQLQNDMLLNLEYLGAAWPYWIVESLPAPWIPYQPFDSGTLDVYDLYNGLLAGTCRMII